MIIHTIFDFAAWIAAFAMSVFVARRHYLDAAPRTPMRDPGYFIALGLGAIAGALLFGSLNMTLAGIWQIGHSIAGAVAGGIVAVEIFKWRTGIRGSTGGQFVAPLALGIAVGRLGLLLRRPAGLHLWHADRRCPGAWISATAFRAIRCSSMNRPRCCCFSSSICAAIARGSQLFPATGLLSFRRLVRAAAVRLGIPQALSGA